MIRDAHAAAILEAYDKGKFDKALGLTGFGRRPPSSKTKPKSLATREKLRAAALARHAEREKARFVKVG